MDKTFNSVNYRLLAFVLLTRMKIFFRKALHLTKVFGVGLASAAFVSTAIYNIVIGEKGNKYISIIIYVMDVIYLFLKKNKADKHLSDSFHKENIVTFFISVALLYLHSVSLGLPYFISEKIISYFLKFLKLLTKREVVNIGFYFETAIFLGVFYVMVPIIQFPLLNNAMEIVIGSYNYSLNMFISLGLVFSTTLIGFTLLFIAYKIYSNESHFLAPVS